MSDLSKALAAVGETGPERPDALLNAKWSEEAISKLKPRSAALMGERLRLSYLALEHLAQRLAERLKHAERCRECDGGYYLSTDPETHESRQYRCEVCSGTGKEPR